MRGHLLPEALGNGLVIRYSILYRCRNRKLLLLFRIGEVVERGDWKLWLRDHLSQQFFKMREHSLYLPAGEKIHIVFNRHLHLTVRFFEIKAQVKLAGDVVCIVMAGLQIAELRFFTAFHIVVMQHQHHIKQG